MNDTELDQLLQTCGAPVRVPRAFQHDVWCRIEAAEQDGWRARAVACIERGLGFLALPPVAVATCAAMVAAGAWFGMESGNLNDRGDMTYVRSISPFAQSHR